MNLKEDRKVINRFADYVKRINETRFEQMNWFDYRAEPEVVKGHYKRIAQEILKDEVFKGYQEYQNELLDRIDEAIRATEQREEEITKAIEKVKKDKENYGRCYEKYNSRARGANGEIDNKYIRRYGFLYNTNVGYFMFFDPVELDRILDGDTEVLEKAYERIKKDYPYMAPDIEEDVKHLSEERENN